MFVQVKKLHPVGDQDVRLNPLAIAYTYPIQQEGGGLVIRMTGGETFSIAGSAEELEAAIYDALSNPGRMRPAPAADRDAMVERQRDMLRAGSAETSAAAAANVVAEPEKAGARAALGDGPTAGRRRPARNNQQAQDLGLEAATPAAPAADAAPGPVATTAEPDAEKSADAAAEVEELPAAEPEVIDPLAPAEDK